MRGLEPVIRAYVRWVVERRGGLDLQTIERIWPIAVGKVWAERARPVALRGSRLVVGVPDGVWLAELRYQREHVLPRLNALLPADTTPPITPIESMKLVVRELPDWEPPSSASRERPMVPLTEDQASALAEIADPALREVVRRVVMRDIGRLERRAEEGDEGT